MHRDKLIFEPKPNNEQDFDEEELTLRKGSNATLRDISRSHNKTSFLYEWVLINNPFPFRFGPRQIHDFFKCTPPQILDL
jgi:hypothetical protein